MLVYIFDIDGTLADHRWRLPRIKPQWSDMTYQDWEAFHLGCEDDPPLKAGIEAVLGAIAAGNIVKFYTNRYNSVRWETLRWLSDQLCRGETWCSTALRTREEGSMVDGPDMKRAWLHQEFKLYPHINPENFIVYEDCPRHCQMFRDEGCTVLQVFHPGFHS